MLTKKIMKINLNVNVKLSTIANFTESKKNELIKDLKSKLKHDIEMMF